MDYLAVYVTVYEHKGLIFPGYTREFMRHSAITVDKEDGSFPVFHVTGTPGIALTYSSEATWKDPRTQTARLLAMDFVAWIPKERYEEMGLLLSGVKIKVSKHWNCQNWVREGLDGMVGAGLITAEQRTAVVEKQKAAITTPFTTEAPNTQALQD